jgi:hypothetical protein
MDALHDDMAAIFVEPIALLGDLDFLCCDIDALLGAMTTLPISILGDWADLIGDLHSLLIDLEDPLFGFGELLLFVNTLLLGDLVNLLGDLEHDLCLLVFHSGDLLLLLE